MEPQRPDASMTFAPPPAGSWSASDPMAEVGAETWAIDPSAPTTARPLLLDARALRWLGFVAAVATVVLTGFQVARLLGDEPWSPSIALAALALAVVTTISVLVWTWIVVENGRRLLSLAQTQQSPDPAGAVAAWAAPIIVLAASGTAVAFLQRRLDVRPADDPSPIPLGIVFAAVVLAMLVAYRPLHILASVTRRLGGRSIDLTRFFWVPVTLAATGALTLWALGAGGAYGDEFDGLVPAWALGVVAIPPTIILFALAWRGGRAAEDAVAFAFDRRRGDVTAGIGRGRLGFMARALRADARPPIARDVRRRIRLVPGAEVLRLALVVMIAGLALLSIIGAIVMFLFWREASDGFLLQSQRDRAWEAIDALRSVERLAVVGLLCVVSVWSFVNVLNARLATGRRRNPLLAALAWPAVAFAIWRIADRVADDERIGAIVAAFALQAVVAYLPFFLLERAAVAVGARRQPIRAAYGLGVILLVHVQGLVGLSTLDNGAATDQFGRLAGYLALAAFLQLLSTLTLTEASRLIADGASNEVERHNFLAEQRDELEHRSNESARRSAEAEAHPAADPVSV